MTDQEMRQESCPKVLDHCDQLYRVSCRGCGGQTKFNRSEVKKVSSGKPAILFFQCQDCGRELQTGEGENLWREP